jgi:hypothetical protein
MNGNTTASAGRAVSHRDVTPDFLDVSAGRSSCHLPPDIPDDHYVSRRTRASSFTQLDLHHRGGLPLSDL